MENPYADGCRGKVRFPSRRRAAAAIRVMRYDAATRAPETLVPYRCREMRSHWHVGHHTRPAPPKPLMRVKAAVGDVVEVVWRRANGTETRTRHEAPQE